MPNESGHADELTEEVIEVTAAMVKAGVEELREKMFGDDLAEIVTDVPYAMLAAR
jgi:hypothetical protein